MILPKNNAYLLLEIKLFLESNRLEFESILPNIFFLTNFNFFIVALSLENDFELERWQSSILLGKEFIIIHQDLWHTKGAIIRDKLLAKTGRGKSVFARNCVVERVDSNSVNPFLEANHLLGKSKSKYKYQLKEGDNVVAVATFSAPRPMQRADGVVESFEWVRYASLGSLRVIGGMGKLLAAFVKEVKPQEIMSYADLEWSRGEAYLKLGFELVERTPPIKFLVNRESYKRIAYSKKEGDNPLLLSLTNLGNLKFLRRFSSF